MSLRGSVIPSLHLRKTPATLLDWNRSLQITGHCLLDTKLCHFHLGGLLYCHRASCQVGSSRLSCLKMGSCNTLDTHTQLFPLSCHLLIVHTKIFAKIGLCHSSVQKSSKITQLSIKLLQTWKFNSIIQLVCSYSWEILPDHEFQNIWGKRGFWKGSEFD